MSKQEASLYEFGPFRLDLTEKVLWRDGRPVALTPKAFDTLVVLVEQSGHLIEKEELIKQLWPDNFVEENSLSQNIYLLRKALGEESKEAKYIETVPRRGYRFVAGVRAVGRATSDVIIEEHTRAHILISEETPELPPLGMADHLALPPAPRPIRLAGLVALSLTVLVGMVVTLFLLRNSFQRPGSNPEVKTIAVLPFKPLGAQGNDEHLGLGLSDALIAKFGNIRQLTVRPTSAIFKYAGQSYDVFSAGRELGVDAVLEGTVQRAGDRVRVTVQLFNVRSGQLLWAERFDESFTNVFAVQDAVSAQVAQALALRLTTDERQLLVKHYTDNAAAYQSYARGLFFWNKRTEEGLARSLEYFKQAVENDQRYALAWAGLADTYALIGYLGYRAVPEKEAFQQAQNAALKALALDGKLAEAHTALSIVKAYRDYNLPDAEATARQAVALQPNNATAHQRYAIYLRDQGRLEESLKAVQRAAELDPLSPTIGTNLAYVYYLRRDYDRAIAQCNKVLETEPEYFQTLIALGMIYEQQQRYQEAIAVLGKVRQRSRGQHGVYYNVLETLGHAYAAGGYRKEAEQVLAELAGFPESEGDTSYYAALIRAGLGEADRAFALLGSSAKSWRLPPVALRLDPRFEQLRADGRYQNLFKKKPGFLPPTS